MWITLSSQHTGGMGKGREKKEEGRGRGRGKEEEKRRVKEINLCFKDVIKNGSRAISLGSGS